MAHRCLAMGPDHPEDKPPCLRREDTQGATEALLPYLGGSGRGPGAFDPLHRGNSGLLCSVVQCTVAECTVVFGDFTEHLYRCFTEISTKSPLKVDVSPCCQRGSLLTPHSLPIFIRRATAQVVCAMVTTLLLYFSEESKEGRVHRLVPTTYVKSSVKGSKDLVEILPYFGPFAANIRSDRRSQAGEKAPDASLEALRQGA